MLLYQILASTMHGKIYKSYIKTKILKFQLQHGADGSYYVSDIPRIIKYIIKKYETVAHNPM